ncbi:MAG: radical SAM protein, partial [Clostridiales bacterium]|nr:radical SAM protein [Clostridiales bacterium]
TLNGGEALLQWEIAEMLLRECKNESINTCVETALHVPWEHAEPVFRYTDLVIADIKHMDTIRHREITGAGNELILENLKKTAALGKKLVIRTPVVPGYNADEWNIRKTGEFIREKLLGNIVAYQLLPYRRLGIEKYESLGDEYPMGDYEPPERLELERDIIDLADMLRRDYGIPAAAGSSEKLII